VRAVGGRVGGVGLGMFRVFEGANRQPSIDSLLGLHFLRELLAAACQKNDNGNERGIFQEHK
jgi:hypothetical protein